MVPLEFIPPTILLAICAVVWLLVRLDRYLSKPAEVPLTMADLEAEWAKSAPMREAALHAKPYNVEEDW